MVIILLNLKMGLPLMLRKSIKADRQFSKNLENDIGAQNEIDREIEEDRYLF